MSYILPKGTAQRRLFSQRFSGSADFLNGHLPAVFAWQSKETMAFWRKFPGNRKFSGHGSKPEAGNRVAPKETVHSPS